MSKDTTPIPGNQNLPATNWSEVVARGLKAKVPTALQRKDQFGMPQHLETIVMYEDENLADQLRAQKAAAIIQQALHPGTVLFTFGSDVFQDRTLAYNTIEKEIGPAKGFRPISLYGNQRRNELIIEANFRNIEDASRAIKQGFTHEGIQYRGTPS